MKNTIELHEQDYTPNAYAYYTFAELGQWVNVLTLRASMGNNPEKVKKDLSDARNYLAMMEEKLTKMEKDFEV